MIRKGEALPSVLFNTRVRDEAIEGSNPYRWELQSSGDYFEGKRVILFGLPGAFTPTCSTYQLPTFEKLFPEFNGLGIDEIYCISVNDAFVMNAWAKNQDLEHVKVIPDGSGTFTREIGMLVAKDNVGFGLRSWRYAMVVDNGVVEAFFPEAGMTDNLHIDQDPYEISTPENLLAYCRTKSKAAA